MTYSRFPDAPPQIAALPLDVRGYPVPAFVPWINGEPEFRAVYPETAAWVHRKSLCWICGRPLPGLKAFVIGPMCAVNRISSEPPSHLDCASFAATACPFLSRPMAKRKPIEGAVAGPGQMIERNPGVTLVWLTRSYRIQREHNGLLFRIGPPVAVQWYAEGREASRDEVMASITSGVPLLAKLAYEDGPEAVTLLEKMTARALKLVPA